MVLNHLKKKQWHELFLMPPMHFRANYLNFRIKINHSEVKKDRAVLFSPAFKKTLALHMKQYKNENRLSLIKLLIPMAGIFEFIISIIINVLGILANHYEVF